MDFAIPKDLEDLLARHTLLIAGSDEQKERWLRPLRMAHDPPAGPGGHLEVALEDCRVPYSNLLGGEGEGFKIAHTRGSRWTCRSRACTRTRAARIYDGASEVHRMVIACDLFKAALQGESTKMALA
jgi:hypothetical protein